MRIRTLDRAREAAVSNRAPFPVGSDVARASPVDTLAPTAMRTLLYALLVAAVPVGLYGPFVGAEGPGAAYPVEPATRWLHLGVISAAAVLLYFAYRRKGGPLGPGIAAGLVFAVYPATADAVVSPFWSFATWTAVAGAAGMAVLQGIVRRAGAPRGSSFLPMMGVLALFVFVLPSGRGARDYGACALDPFLLGAFLSSLLAGEFCETLLRSEGPMRGAKRWLIHGLALTLVLSAFLGQWRAWTWSGPAAFWDRAAREEPRNPAALGASAGARADAGKGPYAVASRLRSFVEASAAGGQEGLGGEARRVGAEGAVRAATLLLSTGDPADRETAEAALRAARSLSPDSVPVLVALGEAHLARGDFMEALKVLSLSVQKDARCAEAWDALARARLAGGRVPEAVDAALHATGLRPLEKRFVVTFAKALLAQGRGSEALNALWGALGPSPPFDPLVARAFGDAEVRLARKAVSEGRKGQARRLLTAGLKVDADNADARDLLGRLDREMEEERPRAEKFLEPGPDGKVQPNDWLGYAAWLCRWGEYEKAEPHFRRMMKELGGPAIPFHYGREFWESRGTVEGAEEAVRAYRQAIALKQDYPEAWNRLWQCLNTLGRIEEARKAADMFLRYDRSHPDAPAAEEFLRRTRPAPADGGNR